MKNKKSYMSWSWTIIVLFFVLSIIDYRFGILGFICMGAPIFHAIKGDGKLHCVKYCPRGSFLGKIVGKISLNNKMPNFMKTNVFKDGLLLLMISLLSFSIYHANGDVNKIAFSMLRFMGSSFVVGILFGIFFKGRSWCVVCPMGRATGKIQKMDLSLSNKKRIKN